MKHEEYLKEKDFAHMDVSIMLEYEEGFSMIEKLADCVKAVYTDRRSGQRYYIRMECCHISEVSKSFKAETDFYCPIIRPEFTGNVSLYAELANEKINTVNDSIDSQRCSFEIKETEDGSFVLAQAFCGFHEDIPDAVEAMVKAVAAFGDDLICLAKGQIPIDLMEERVLKNYITKICLEREHLPDEEDLQRLRKELAANTAGASAEEQNAKGADGEDLFAERNEEDPEEDAEEDHTDEEILLKIGRDMLKKRGGYKGRYFKNPYIIEDEDEEDDELRGGASEINRFTEVVKKMMKREEPDSEDDDPEKQSLSSD